MAFLAKEEVLGGAVGLLWVLQRVRSPGQPVSGGGRHDGARRNGTGKRDHCLRKCIY